MKTQQIEIIVENTSITPCGKSFPVSAKRGDRFIVPTDTAVLAVRNGVAKFTNPELAPKIQQKMRTEKAVRNESRSVGVMHQTRTASQDDSDHIIINQTVIDSAKQK